MRSSKGKKEQGYVVVEAAILFPLVILSTILLLYLSLFLFWRANLQTSLENTVIYYKNTITDTYVSRNNQIAYKKDDSSYMGVGNQYKVTDALSPYRGLFGDGNDLGSQAAFERYFDSATGGKLVKDDLELTINYDNYILMKQLEVTANQKVKFPINFSILGIKNEYTISATARVSVVDHDALIRDADYAIDLIEDTKLGEMAKSIGSKVSSAYEKLKNTLGVK